MPFVKLEKTEQTKRNLDKLKKIIEIGKSYLTGRLNDFTFDYENDGYRIHFVAHNCPMIVCKDLGAIYTDLDSLNVISAKDNLKVNEKINEAINAYFILIKNFIESKQRENINSIERILNEQN